MANYSHREVIVRRVEYSLPSGDIMDEFDKTYGAAATDWRVRHGKAQSDRLDGDWSRVEARDDEVVITFTVEEPPGADAARIEAARKAYAEVLLTERTHAGHGRDGHLSPEDLEPIWRALTGPVNG